MTKIEKTKTKHNTYGFGADEKRLEWFKGMEERVQEIFYQVKKSRKALQDARFDDALEILLNIEKPKSKRLILDMMSYRTTVHGQGTGVTGKKVGEK